MDNGTTINDNDMIESCSSWPLKHKCAKQKRSVPAAATKSRKGTKLQTKTKFQQQMLE